MGKKAYRILPRGAILFGAIAGTIAAGLVLSYCRLLSKTSSRPWWDPRNLAHSLAAFFLVGGLALGYEALRRHTLRPLKDDSDT